MLTISVLFVAVWLNSFAFCRWMPRPGLKFQIQFHGDFNPVAYADVFDVDLFTTSDDDMRRLKNEGKKIICYFSAGTYEEYRSDVKHVPGSLLGDTLHDYHDERYWDIRSSVIRGILTSRLRYALSRGCDGVDPDNMDSYKIDRSLGLTESNQIDFNKWLAYEAHVHHLAIGMKNAVDLVPALESSFDFAINEQCVHYHECGNYQRFLSHHKAVFNIEYVNSHSERDAKRSSVCHSSYHLSRMSTVIKDKQLSYWYTHC